MQPPAAQQFHCRKQKKEVSFFSNLHKFRVLAPAEKKSGPPPALHFAHFALACLFMGSSVSSRSSIAKTLRATNAMASTKQLSSSSLHLTLGATNAISATKPSCAAITANERQDSKDSKDNKDITEAKVVQWVLTAAHRMRVAHARYADYQDIGMRYDLLQPLVEHLTVGTRVKAGLVLHGTASSKSPRYPAKITKVDTVGGRTVYNVKYDHHDVEGTNLSIHCLEFMGAVYVDHQEANAREMLKTTDAWHVAVMRLVPYFALQTGKLKIGSWIWVPRVDASTKMLHQYRCPIRSIFRGVTSGYLTTDDDGTVIEWDSLYDSTVNSAAFFPSPVGDEMEKELVRSCYVHGTRPMVFHDAKQATPIVKNMALQVNEEPKVIVVSPALTGPSGASTGTAAAAADLTTAATTRAASASAAATTRAASASAAAYPAMESYI